MTNLSTLPEEVMHLVSSYLTAREIHIFFVMSSKDLKQTFAESYHTWRQILGTASHDIILPLLYEYGHDKRLLEDYNNPNSSSYAKMARTIAGMEDLSMCHWRQARYGCADDIFSEQEAHSSVLLTSPCRRKKYLAVVPGWGKAKKQIEIFDVTRLPNIRRVKSQISGAAAYFKYGHSSTKVNDSLVMIFGGLTCGGYRGAINLLTQGDIEPYCHLNEDNHPEENQSSSSGAKRTREDTFSRNNDDERSDDDDDVDRSDRIMKGRFTLSADPMDGPITPVRPGPWCSTIPPKTTSSSSDASASSSIVENATKRSQRERKSSFSDLNDQFSHMSASYDIDNEDVDSLNRGGFEDLNDQFSHMSASYDIDNEEEADETDDDNDRTNIINDGGCSNSCLPEVNIMFRVVQYATSPFYVPNDLGGIAVPTPRGYHTATVVDICRQSFLLVWGGLGNCAEDDPGNALDDVAPYENDAGQVLFRGTKPIAQLELLNCGTMKWHTRVEATGVEPSPRYGHSCTYHSRTNSLIVVGGASSNDLLWKGEELREVYILTIIPPLGTPADIVPKDQSCQNTDVDVTLFNDVAFVWSQVRVSCDSEALLVPGRCHSSSLVSRDKLLLFGGSAFGTTNSVVVMDLTTLDARKLRDGDYATGTGSRFSSFSISRGVDEGSTKDDSDYRTVFSPSIRMYSPVILGEVPTERLSALCANVGKFFLIQGGYDTAEKEGLNDCQVLDISCSTA